MSRRSFSLPENAGFRRSDLVIAAGVVALLGYVAATTLRPVLHNAAATAAELRGDTVAAERHLQEAIVQARRFEARSSLTTSIQRLADLHWKDGRYADAQEQLVELLGLWEARLGSQHPMVAEALERLGLAAQFQDDFALADARLRRSLEIRESALGPDHPATARSLLRLGSLYRVTGEGLRADLYLGRALAILEARGRPAARLSTLLPGLAGADRSNDAVLAEVLYELATVRSRQGRSDEALSLAERALSRARTERAPARLEVAVLSQLGGLEQARGRSDTALRHHARARRLLEEHGLEGTLIEAAVLNNLAISQRANGEPQAARESLERARRILAGRPDGPRRLSVAVSSNFGVLATGP